MRLPLLPRSWATHLRIPFGKAKKELSISTPTLQARPAGRETEDDIPTTLTRHSTGPGFQFMSDLHLERFFNKDTGQYKELVVPQTAPYLILAGDIGQFRDTDAFRACLRRTCQDFKRVFLVAGNHEFYGSSRQQGLDIAAAFAQEMPNLSFLNRGRVDVEDNTIILGCTLHSFIPDDAQGLTNDFERIQDWQVADHNAEHNLDRAWLQQSLKDIHLECPSARVIVVTHYAPSFAQTSHPWHEDSAYRYCFCSDVLDSFQSWQGADQVTHWIFGHTHHNARFACGTTLVVSNQPQDRECARKFDLEASV